jgi:hypothetical protein
MWHQNKISLQEKRQEQKRIEEEVRDINKLVTVRCARCGRKINLLTCGYDDNFAPVCTGFCK